MPGARRGRPRGWRRHASGVHLPRRVAVRRVWATHGHYLDHHLFPVSALRGRSGGCRATARADRLRATRRPSLARIGRSGCRARSPRCSTISPRSRARRRCRVPRRLLHRRSRPLTSTLLGDADAPREHPGAGTTSCTASASTPTGSSSAMSIGSGRSPATIRRSGAGPAGARGSLNTGSWCYEPLLVHRATPRTRTGRAARSCSRRRRRRAQSGCSTTSPPTCSEATYQRRIRWLSPNSCQR